MSQNNSPRLGYGCVKLTSFSSNKKAKQILTFLYDNGMRWFDTAPLYGNGYSERILGGFIKSLSKNDRAQLKVVTKFGLGPDKIKFLPIDIALKLNKLNKLQKRTIKNNSFVIEKEVQSIVTRRIFDFEKIQKQLDNSLINLGIEQLHGYIGHELIPDFLDDDTKKYLFNSKQDGKILNLGIGVNSTSILSIVNSKTLNDWEILQYEAGGTINVKNLMNQYPDKIHVHHSILKKSEVTSNSSNLNLIESHLEQFPNSHILFSSNNKSHIVENIASMKKWH
jgi:aryl-alcohol dehydrogenase-like predicted oxidoreductase